MSDNFSKLNRDYKIQLTSYLCLTITNQGGRGLDWLELDTTSPSALRRIRDRAAMPIASLESVMGRQSLLPFLLRSCLTNPFLAALWQVLTVI